MAKIYSRSRKSLSSPGRRSRPSATGGTAVPDHAASASDVGFFSGGPTFKSGWRSSRLIKPRHTLPDSTDLFAVFHSSRDSRGGRRHRWADSGLRANAGQMSRPRQMRFQR